MTSPAEFRRAGAPQQPAIAISPGGLNLRNATLLYNDTLTVGAGLSGGAEINPQGYGTVMIAATSTDLGTVRLGVLLDNPAVLAISPWWVLQGQNVDTGWGARVVESFPVMSPLLVLVIDNLSADDATLTIAVYGIDAPTTGLALGDPNLYVTDHVLRLTDTIAGGSVRSIGTEFVRHAVASFNVYTEFNGSASLSLVDADGTKRDIWRKIFTAHQDFGPCGIVIGANPLYFNVENDDVGDGGCVMYMNTVQPS